MTEQSHSSQPSLSQTSQMASSDLTDKIYKSLRLVPEFNGNPNVLTRFLNLCDELVLTYVSTEPGSRLSNLALINGILNKITGTAARTLATNGIPSDWQGIRTTLINSFSDHRDETSLYTDLSLLVQSNDTIQVYYEKVQHLLCTIITYVELHESVGTTVEAKRTLYKNLALQTFLRGLDEPLGSRVRCMRPSSLESALEFAQEELNVLYLQKRNKSLPAKKNLYNFYEQAPNTSNAQQNFRSSAPNLSHQQQNFRSYMPPNYNPIFQTYPRPQIRSFGPQYPPQLYPPPVPLEQNRQPYPRPQNPTKTLQMFRAPPTNMSTGFRIPPRAPQVPQINQVPQYNTPTPMSGISHPVARTLPPTNYNGKRNLEPNLPQIGETHFNEFLDDNTALNFHEYDPNIQNFDPVIDTNYFHNFMIGLELDPNQNPVEGTTEQNFCPAIEKNAPV